MYIVDNGDKEFSTDTFTINVTISQNYMMMPEQHFVLNGLQEKIREAKKRYVANLAHLPNDFDFFPDIVKFLKRGELELSPSTLKNNGWITVRFTLGNESNHTIVLKGKKGDPLLQLSPYTVRLTPPYGQRTDLRDFSFSPREPFPDKIKAGEAVVMTSRFVPYEGMAPGKYRMCMLVDAFERRLGASCGDFTYEP